jgi:hypothetical protein
MGQINKPVGRVSEFERATAGGVFEYQIAKIEK